VTGSLTQTIGQVLPTGDFMATAIEHGDNDGRLKRGAIGPIGLAALAIGILSPALGLYALWPPIQTSAGPIAPLVYICAMLMALPTAISYAVLNAEAPAAGGASTWLWQSVSPSFGYVIGLVMATYFLIGAIAQPLLFGLFAQDLLAFMGYGSGGKPTMIVSVFVATIPIIWMTRKGAETSVKTAVILMCIESMIVVGLSATILFVKLHQHHGINLAPFNPRFGSGGVYGFWNAMIIGVLAYAGFDVVSTAAEEAAAPRKHVPRAILFTMLGVTLFWVVNSWIYTLAAPATMIKTYTAEGMTAVIPMAKLYWGRGNILIVLTAFTGISAIYISSVISSSRVIFALARHRLLPQPLAALHHVYRVPTNAMCLVFAVVVVCGVFTALILGNGIAGFLWWSNAMVFFFTITFMGVNVANIFYFRRVAPHRFKVLHNLVVPSIGLATNFYLIYEAFFISLWSDPSGRGRSTVIFCIGLLFTWLLSAAGLSFLRPQRLQGLPPIGVD
jgi:amino acid transporter